eukprot:3336642-Lingulodinium_polyedra.AAC.1
MRFFATATIVAIITMLAMVSKTLATATTITMEALLRAPKLILTDTMAMMIAMMAVSAVMARTMAVM